MLKWNVYVENINKRCIEVYNIFEHGGFRRGLQELVKKKSDKNNFLTEVKHLLMYLFWSKCEWEIIISDFPPSHGCTTKEFLDGLYKAVYNHDDKEIIKVASKYENNPTEKKIDVYSQVMLNWDIFGEYIWENKDKI